MQNGKEISTERPASASDQTADSQEMLTKRDSFADRMKSIPIDATVTNRVTGLWCGCGRTKFEAAREKREALNAADAAGEVCDSHALRLALMRRVRDGEITLAEAQAELKRIQRDGKKNGIPTRAQVHAKA